MKPKTVDSYIEQFPPKTRAILKKLRMTARKLAPDAEESISYGMPGFKLNKRPLVYFAAWENHIGFYATPSGNSAFKKELSRYEGGKGSVRFPISKPLPMTLIGKIIKFKINDNLRK